MAPSDPGNCKPEPRERGVYRVEDWAEVQRLFHREGLTKRATARRLKMSRTTVTRLLALKQPPAISERRDRRWSTRSRTRDPGHARRRCQRARDGHL
jgi:hypothetical protein